MAESASDRNSRLRGDPAKSRLREDLTKEYYALFDAISNYDGRLLIVKGWSVTLSLAALGLAFQQRHYALFLLAAVTGAAFWLLDGLMKGFQNRYYIRMREIEYTAYLVNAVKLGGEYGDLRISAPRIDMTWDFTGYPVDEDGKPLPVPPLLMPLWLWRRMLKRGKRPPLMPPWLWRILKLDKKPEPGYDWRADEPQRREPQEIYKTLRRCWWFWNVMLPHVLAVGLGTVLFIIFAALNASGAGNLRL